MKTCRKALDFKVVPLVESNQRSDLMSQRATGNNKTLS